MISREREEELNYFRSLQLNAYAQFYLDQINVSRKNLVITAAFITKITYHLPKFIHLHYKLFRK